MIDFDVAIAEREKRRVWFHEAGHAAVCHCFGGHGLAEVWQNTAQNVDAGQSAWLGHFKTFIEPGSLVVSDEIRQLMGVLPVPNNWRVLFGMAGLVAEHVADGITDAAEIMDSIVGALMYGDVSDTDAAAMGTEWGVADVAKVVQILRDRWPAIERDVSWRTCE
jgi:hypothetical protein